MPEFRMPSLGADMTEGKVTAWLVKPGDRVHRGDLIAEVDTEKTVMEVESFEDGVVTELLAEIGDTVPVGTPIARIESAATAVLPSPEPASRPPSPASVPERPAHVGTASAGRHGAGRTAEPRAAAVPHATPPVRRLAHERGVDLDQVHGTGLHGAITRADVEHAAAPQPAVTGGRPEAVAPIAESAHVRSSPRARRLAHELAIDLTTVRGTGPGGAVTMRDVRASASAPPPAPAPVPAPAHAHAHAHAREESSEEGRTAKLRRAVGALMARSKREIPHYYLSTSIDLGTALEWMRRVNAARPIADRLVPSALLLTATARAAKNAPDMNGFFVDDAFHPSTAVHLGVAIAVRGGGLVAPALHDADALSADQVMQRLRDLVRRARAGRLQRAEMSDPTITVTNLGDLGVETIFGVIYPPQVALVGFGGIRETVVAREGLIGARPTVTATLSADHRVSDGLAGSRFLASIGDLLQNPEEL